MKREDKTNKNRHKVEKTEQKKLFTLGEVQSLAALIAAGVMGVGGRECIEEAEKLPEELQKVLIAATMAARECMLESILAKAGKQRNN